MHFFGNFKLAALASAVSISLATNVSVAQTNKVDSVQTSQLPAVQASQFEDWFVRCVDMKTAEDKTVKQCEVVQIAQVKQGEENVNVLTLAIAKTAPAAGKKPSNNDLLLTALVPLNVFLPIGLSLRVDEKDLVTIPYRNCNQTGCWVQQKLDGKMLASMQKGSAGEARLRLMNGQNINLKFSLKGLTKVLAELQNPSQT